MLETSGVTEHTRARKVNAVLWALVVHIVLVILFAFIVILPAIFIEPELIAEIQSAPQSLDQAKVKRSVTKQVEKSAARAGGSSAIAKLIRANAAASIAAPKVETVTTAPLGLGQGDFGMGGFGSGSGGSGSGGAGRGGTLFGRTGGGGLVGRLFDMKQDRSGNAVAYNPGVQTFFEPIVSAGEKHFSEASLDGFYEAKVKLGYTFLAIPYIKAEEGPKAFQAEKEIEPRGWFVHYTGFVSPPESGEYRFVGAFDDALFVYINDKMVFDGSWDDVTKDASIRQNFGGPSMIATKPVWAGKWIKLSSSAKIDIIVGERPGGWVGGSLLIQRRGAEYRTRGDGTPILPVFSAVTPSDKDKARLRAMDYEFEENTPVFGISSRNKRSILQF